MLANGEDPGRLKADALWRRIVGNRVRDRFVVAVSRARKRDDGRAGAFARGALRCDRIWQQAGAGRVSAGDVRLQFLFPAALSHADNR